MPVHRFDQATQQHAAEHHLFEDGREHGDQNGEDRDLTAGEVGGNSGDFLLRAIVLGEPLDEREWAISVHIRDCRCCGSADAIATVRPLTRKVHIV